MPVTFSPGTLPPSRAPLPTPKAEASRNVPDAVEAHVSPDPAPAPAAADTPEVLPDVVLSAPLLAAKLLSTVNLSAEDNALDQSPARGSALRDAIANATPDEGGITPSADFTV